MTVNDPDDPLTIRESDDGLTLIFALGIVVDVGIVVGVIVGVGVDEAERQRSLVRPAELRRTSSWHDFAVIVAD